MQYTPSQLEAIRTIDQNLQIIACAGSGKTQVVSARIVEILRHGSAPGNVVAFTFTEKAAGELKDRIDRLCLADLGTNQGLGDMFVGTIHGYCLNVLQAPPLYRYLKYTVLDEVQQRLLIDRNSTKSGLTQTPFLNGKGPLKRWRDSALYQQLISIYSESDIDHTQVPDSVHEAIAQYYQLLHDKRNLDFTMIMAEAVQVLETDSTVRQQIADQVRYLVVDEYQDVNPLQERLIRLIHDLGANLCVVGDDDQTIYQWRGSDVTNIITFADRYPNVKQVRINENFRSSVAIIESARQVIERNPDRLAKRMETFNTQPFQYGDVLALSFDTPQDEAAWIAHKIQSLHGTEYRDRPDSEPRGLTYLDFAVLMRSVRNDAGPIKDALDDAGVPYVVSGMTELFNTLEVGVMRLIFFYLADFALPGEPPITVANIRQFLELAHLGLSDAQIEAGVAFLQERKAAIGSHTDATLRLQRVYLDFLETIQLREENIPAHGSRTGEIVFYNLGSFSEVISDFETIHFNSAPNSYFPGFASFLHYQAPSYYPEGWEEGGYVQLDAVQILTVHKAKGMQWPVVFVPCLRRNRFPSKRQGGRSVWHIIPEESVPNADRYKGTCEDERRLFYVALTRAERYLFCSWSPIADNQLYRRVSLFLQELTSSDYVLSQEPPVPPQPAQLPPRPRHEDASLALTFSELKYFFDCSYSFRLRFLYGFNPPIDQALGYGKSLHDALAEIHSESIRGNIPAPADALRLVDEHLHLPYASDHLRDTMHRTAAHSLTTYLNQHAQDLDKLEHVEKIIELRLADGIVVNGRIDLIRRTDTNQWAIVDFKSTQHAQAEETTRQQLQTYALGFEQLTGKRADLIEIHNLDDGGVHREQVDQQLIQDTVTRIAGAGPQPHDNHLPPLAKWCDTCAQCDVAGLCPRHPSHP